MKEKEKTRIKRFDTIAEAIKYGQTLPNRFSSELVLVDGKRFMLCNTELAYSIEFWREALKLLKLFGFCLPQEENVINNYTNSEIEDNVDIDKLRDKIIEAFEEIAGYRFLNAFDYMAIERSYPHLATLFCDRFLSLYTAIPKDHITILDNLLAKLEDADDKNEIDSCDVPETMKIWYFSKLDSEFAYHEKYDNRFLDWCIQKSKEGGCFYDTTCSNV